MCLSTSSPTCFLQASKTWSLTGKPSWQSWVTGALHELTASGTSHVSPGLLHILQDHLSFPKINLIQGYAWGSCIMNFYPFIPAKAKPRFPLTPPWQGTLAHSTKPSVPTSLGSLSHPPCPPMDMPAAHTGAEGTCKTRLVTKCLHTSICPFQTLFSHVHLWRGKKHSSQNIVSSVKRHKDVWLQGFQPHRRSRLRKGSPLKMET